MTKLTPTLEELNALRQTEPAGPVVMVNLLKFRPDGGREAYLKYAQAAMSAAPEGMRIIYAGTAGTNLAAGEGWDFVILAEYPSFAAFADFVCGQIYQEQALPHRPTALERTLWMISRAAGLADISNAA